MLASCSRARPHPLTSAKVRMQWIHTLKLAAVTWTSPRTKSLNVLQHLKKMSGLCGSILSSTSTSNLLRDSRNAALLVFTLGAITAGGWRLWAVTVAGRGSLSTGVSGSVSDGFDAVEVVISPVSLVKDGSHVAVDRDVRFDPVPTHSRTNRSIIQSRWVFTQLACVWMSSEIALAICWWVCRR